MGQFFQKLAARIISGPVRPPILAVTVFGKHPGWDDHMEDAGHQFPEMLTFKRLIYIEGIGGNIDSGSWAHLPDTQRLPQFNHLLIYSNEDYYILASVTASRDGKGRNLYPLVTAVQARGYSLADLAEHVAPLILTLRDTVNSNGSAAAVRSAVQAAQLSLDRLTGTLQPNDMKTQQLLTGSQMAEVLAGVNATPDAAERIIYSLRKAVQNCRRDGANARTETVRLPSARRPPWFSTRMWIGSLRGVLGVGCPLMAVEYLNSSDPVFTDVIIGTVGPSQLFCLRAGTARIPLTTEIPFETDAALREQVAQYIAECRRLNQTAAPPLPI